MWVNLVVTTPGSPSYHFTEVSVIIQSSKEANICSFSAGPTTMDQLQLKTSIVYVKGPISALNQQV